jgi:hypothetical protein
LTSRTETKTSTGNNRKDSALLRLPGELRNKIYGYLVVEGRTYELMGKRALLPHHLAFITICRQILQEAAFIPFGLNVFKFKKVLYLFSRNLLMSSQRCVITFIHLETTLPDANLYASLFKRSAPSLPIRMPSVRFVKVTLQRSHGPLPENWAEFLSIKGNREEMDKFEAWLKGGSDKVRVIWELHKFQHST